MKNIILSLLVFFGGFQLAHTQDIDLLILAPKSTASSPFFLLAEEDAVEGFDISVDVFINHPQAMIRLYRGESDLLFTGTSTGWENRLSGGILVMINTGVWGVSYLMGTDRGIDDFSDLAGKTIALPFPGSPLDFQTRYILTKKGLDPGKDLSISYSPFPQSVAKIMNGQLDVAPLPEPLATFTQRNNRFFRLVDYRDAWAQVAGGQRRSPQVSLFTTEQFSRENSVLLEKLVAEWRKKTIELGEDPVRAARISAPYLEMPLDIIEEAIRNTEYHLPTCRQNRLLVLEYYHTVRDYLPEKRGELDEGFFFLPDQEE